MRPLYLTTCVAIQSSCVQDQNCFFLVRCELRGSFAFGHGLEFRDVVIKKVECPLTFSGMLCAQTTLYSVVGQVIFVM
jgi:hypothetical protein